MSWLADDASCYRDAAGKILPDAILTPAELIVQRFFRSGIAKDRAATMALYREDSVIEIPFNESGRTEEGAYRRYAGLSEIAGFTEASHAAEGDIRVSNVEVHRVEGGRTIFVESRGNIVMSSGREYRNRYVFRFDIDDERIVLLREYYNPITSGIAFGRTIGPTA